MDEQLTSRWWSSQLAEPVPGDEYLQEITHAYWERGKPTPDATPGQRIEWYIKTLLPAELWYAEQKRRALQYHPCDTLVLLVGHSPEPLLQAIGVFEPKRVVLLLNQQYGMQTGESRGWEMKHWIDDWLAPLLPAPPRVEPYLSADSPDAVFHALCEHVLADREKNKDVIVDITGAKKSIVAGAFLFAAYADLPISYVDFDDYNAQYRRPLGFHCRIGTLTNPYDAFRLREWERVQRMYENYHFRAAAGTLRDILGAIRQPGQPSDVATPALFQLHSEHIQAAEVLLDVLHLYEAWDDGDHYRAHGQLQDLQKRLPDFSPPAAVPFLGKRWPHSEGKPSATDAAEQLLRLHEALMIRPHSIFDSNDMLVTYARDEMAKIERLVRANEDNRSAVLRAAGLDELLLKARLVRLWGLGWVDLSTQEDAPMGTVKALDSYLEGKLYQALVKHRATDYMRLALQRHDVYDGYLEREAQAFVRLDKGRTWYRARPGSNAPVLSNYEANSGLRGETVTHLRNQAIHMYLSVTQLVARSAVDLVRANLEDFEEHWAGLSGPSPPIRPGDLECLPWARLCRLCGLDFLPFMYGPYPSPPNPQSRPLRSPHVGESETGATEESQCCLNCA